MNIALIMAAGSGTRMNNDTPKQFLEVYGEPLLWHTVKVFNDCKSIDAIYVVTNKSYFSKVNEITAEFEKVIDVVEGGDSRQESVYKGLVYASKHGFIDEDIVLIHDAARPLVSNEIIEANIETCEKNGSAITSIKVSDTVVKSQDAGKISGTANRNELFRNQTPQTFKLGLILKAYENVKNELNNYTDDCQIALKSFKDIFLVDGSQINLKVTTQDDLKLVEAMLNKK